MLLFKYLLFYFFSKSCLFEEDRRPRRIEFKARIAHLRVSKDVVLPRDAKYISGQFEGVPDELAIFKTTSLESHEKALGCLLFLPRISEKAVS